MKGGEEALESKDGTWHQNHGLWKDKEQVFEENLGLSLGQWETGVPNSPRRKRAQYVLGPVPSIL